MNVYIPGNEFRIPPRYYSRREIVILLRFFKHNADAIQFIADMME